ncbi:AAA family ATPase [Pseudoalteromonas sp. NEC-BIFX-2020_015]|uniref:KAP family P-loop NTPase fold protein n=1 Tax=Pseudoalteromonas sp. NEC-BIFX-2020_015 TaxID=2729544 RepID=UPI0014616923|nr:P-loop NTPase fold protein [Pseudoalteromonas sp. NEC-BIFX-2020_015]NMR26499.1 AAA family ATPase [Pseudoalteromonas sp. NEC-BIFX-2020_015]
MNNTFESRDEFHRKPVAENIIKLLSSSLDISPMMLDGSWGTGKSEFCQKTINLFKLKDTHHLIYVDAFKADHVGEPLVTLLSEIIKLLPEKEQPGFIKKIIPATKFGLKTGGKAFIGHILRQDFASVADDYDKDIQKAADKAIDATVESIIKDQVQADKNLTSLKDAISKVAEEKAIVFFVDELDRCKPSFAVDVLELIKHVFDIDNVQFVLITNSQQLRASINHCYGTDVDSQKYLDKFLKFTIKLSNKTIPNRLEPIFASMTLFEKLVRENQHLPTNLYSPALPKKFIESIIINLELSLREVETLVRYLEVLQVLTEGKAFSENNHLGYLLLNTLAVVIYCFKPDLANEISNSKYDAKEIANILGIKKVNPYPEGHNRPSVHEVLMVVLAKDCDVNTAEFIPKEDQERWDKTINGGFFNWGIDPGYAILELKNTFEVLGLQPSGA